MGAAPGKPQQHKRGRRAAALNMHLATQKDEASNAVSDTLMAAGRLEQVASTIYACIAARLPGCVVKGGAAFPLHFNEITQRLPAYEAGRLNRLVQGLGATRTSDVDITCSPG